VDLTPGQFSLHIIGAWVGTLEGTKQKKSFCLSVKNYYKVVLFIPEVGTNVGTTEGF